jgi:choline dehydrogenase-like flavoprotein
MDWKSASDHYQFFTNFSQHSPLIALCRDYDSVGEVKMDSNGLPRIYWTLSEHDTNSLIMGVEQSIKILVAAGASEVRPAHSSMQPFRGLYKSIKDLETIEFKEYISRMKNLGIEENSCTISSAHQMGTCRLSTTPEKGACDPTGQTWEVQGLYVADASLFPTASGVKCVLFSNRFIE